MERKQRMSRTGDLLLPSRVSLDLTVPDRSAAVRATAELLRGDPLVPSWDQLWAAIAKREAVDLGDSSCGICLAHGRSETMKQLVLCAARLASAVPGTSEWPVRLVFVFVLPVTMAEEYLRKVGALARACSMAEKVEQLQQAEDAENFSDLVNRWLV